MTIGQRIAQKRRELSFSQEALGQEVGSDGLARVKVPGCERIRYAGAAG